jgi:predicted Zn-dependent protease
MPSASSESKATLAAAEGRDLVGIYAAGTLYRGFANSLGQRNWHEVDSFNFDWSLYLEADKAVKSAYAGFDWSENTLKDRANDAAEKLRLLGAPRRTIEPGEYRAYLSPRALEELVGLLAWGGFSARARATKQSPLLRMESGAKLSPKLTLVENTAEGIAPAFQADGFVKPPRVALIENGVLREALVSPRSAKEYGLLPNAGRESPESLEMLAGTLSTGEALTALGEGLYISNLWYLNYSDRPAGRITGMTRFATFWVQAGRIAAPATPMRFDDSVYRMLGTNLDEVTREREWLLDPSTYGERSASSARLPGALLSGLKLTL